MIKKLFGIFIPLCIFSFIAFGISVAILGTGRSYDTAYDTVYISEGTELAVGTASSWEITESYSGIRLDVGAYNVTLSPGDDDTTYFVVTRVGDDKSEITAEIVGDTLEVTIDAGFTLVDFGFDHLDRLLEAIQSGEGFDAIFAGSSLDIIIPQKVYDELEVNMGSGSVEIIDLNARHNTLCINSGRLNYYNGSGFTSDSADIEVNSGFIQVNGISTRGYNIDINSGSYEIFGLSGEGRIEINSGSGTISFDRLDGDCDIDFNSGDMSMYLPRGASADIYADINTGSVYVSTEDNSNCRLRDGNRLTVGGGEYEIYIDMNSGRISISEEYADTDYAVTTTAIADKIPEESAAQSESIIDAVTYIEVPAVPEIPAAPKVPEAPKAPEVPAAPSYALFGSGIARG